MFTKIKFSAVLALIFFISISAYAQIDYASKLKSDVVKIEGGKYITTEFLYLTFADGNTAQVQLSASAPIDVISRDNFIGIYSSYGMILLLATFEEAGMGMPDIKELDELIGDPDLIYNFVMARNGIQIQIISSEGKNNFTLTWEEIYK